MLWNMFRQIPEVRAYYEPLHEKLPEMIRQQIPPQRSHPNVDDYFREYAGLDDLSQHHRADFGLTRLYLEQGDVWPELKEYIEFLLTSTPQGQVPVLQFNNVDLRLGWLRANFPDIPIIHLYRSPREQWFSSIREFPHLVDRGPEPDPYSIATWSRDLASQFPFLSGPYVESAYQRFYYLWRLSYLAGTRQTDLSVAYEDILADGPEEARRLLGVSGLAREENVERAVSIMTSGPSTWREPSHDDEWYAMQEEKSDAMLERLGLSELLGTTALADIVLKSPEYQSQLADPLVRDWQIWSGQLAVLSLERQADEKEMVIQHQATLADEKEAVIQQQVVVIEEKERVVQQFAETSAQLAKVSAQKETDLQSTLSMLHENAAELAVKENVINYLLRFRATSLRYWLVTQPHLLALRLTGRAPSRAQEEEIRERVSREVQSELASETSLMDSMAGTAPGGNGPLGRAGIQGKTSDVLGKAELRRVISWAPSSTIPLDRSTPPSRTPLRTRTRGRCPPYRWLRPVSTTPTF